MSKKKPNKIPARGRSEKKIILLGKRIQKQAEEIERIKLHSKQIYRALEEFIRLLTNFASHDIKNAIHNMDGIISTIKIEDFTQNDIKNLKSSLDSIRRSLEEFKNLSDESMTENFILSKLFNALNLLHRPHVRKNKIDFKVFYSENTQNIKIKQNFHNILQALNNLIINSCKAVENCENAKIHINVALNDDMIEIEVCDNGCGIPEENKGKIFKPYFTTTDGSGVGLTHVKYTVEKINGTIELFDKPNFTTTLKIKIPIENNEPLDSDN